MVIAAQKETLKIAVEIKSFLSHSRMYDFHEALGQFINYRRLLRKIEPERNLYLGVPADAYYDFFVEPFGKDAIEEENLKLVVYNPDFKTIVLWIN